MNEAEGLLEFVEALATGYRERLLGGYCPSGDSGLLNEEMPVVFFSFPAGPLLGLMRLTLSPAVLGHTSCLCLRCAPPLCPMSPWPISACV